MLITHQELYGRVKEELGVNFTDVPEYIVIINYLDEILASGIEFEPAAFIDKVADKELRQKLSALMMQEEPPGDPHSLIADYIKVIKDDDIKCRRETLLKQIEQAEQSKDMELRDKLLMEFSKLI